MAGTAPTAVLFQYLYDVVVSFRCQSEFSFSFFCFSLLFLFFFETMLGVSLVWAWSAVIDTCYRSISGRSWKTISMVTKNSVEIRRNRNKNGRRKSLEFSKKSTRLERRQRRVFFCVPVATKIELAANIRYRVLPSFT